MSNSTVIWFVRLSVEAFERAYESNMLDGDGSGGHCLSSYPSGGLLTRVRDILLGIISLETWRFHPHPMNTEF